MLSSLLLLELAAPTPTPAACGLDLHVEPSNVWSDSEWERRRLAEGTSMGMSMGCGNTSCLASQCLMMVNQLMHDAMAIKLTCDAEADFVRAMIPHHQAHGWCRECC